MQSYLIIGNIFSLLSAIFIAISVIKKNKNDLIWWQILDIIFCILSNIALSTYAALTTNSVALIRNVLAYKNKLTTDRTFILFVLCIVAGLWTNNRGIIGWCPIIASTSYTIFMYVTQNEQQMRWALTSSATRASPRRAAISGRWSGRASTVTKWSWWATRSLPTHWAPAAWASCRCWWSPSVWRATPGGISAMPWRLLSVPWAEGGPSYECEIRTCGQRGELSI